MYKRDEVLEEIHDEEGRLIYQRMSDGYIERNTYTANGKLIKQDITYSNGIREVDHYKG
jgi:hypothetical protein